MPKISIIIPIYNVEKYLGECLDSVINQTFKDIEIICVEGCGTDNSAKIAEEYAQKDERIKIIYHKSNKGLAVSRNDGMDVAVGEYIYFLDSDDYILPDTLEKLYENVCNTQADIVIGKVKAFADDNSNNTIKRTKKSNQYFDKFKSGEYNITLANFIKIQTETPITSWGKLFKKEFLIKNHLKFIEQNVLNEDVGFWLKVCACFPHISCIENIGIMYRIRTTSIMSHRARNKRKLHFNLNLEDAFKFFNEQKPEIAQELIEQVKNNECYCSNFDKKLGIFYKQRWIKDNKLISILGIPIYREKLSNNKRIIRIMGIPVFWGKIKNLIYDTQK